MFIPRTLADTESSGRGAWARAAIVGGFLAVTLFAILSVNIGSGQVNLAVGDVAKADITAPLTVSFFSDSLTEAARTAAEDAVAPVYEPIAPLADIRDRQLGLYDSLTRAVRTVLIQRDAGTIEGGEVLASLSSVLPAFADDQIALLASLPVANWTSITDAGRTVLEATLSAEVHDDKLADARQQVRTNITNDLPQEQREIAGDLAAAHVAPNMQQSVSKTATARATARNAVVEIAVDVREGEIVVREGDPITPLILEKLENLSLTRPRMEVTTLAGHALVAILLASLLVAFLWRFEPTIWFRNRSLLLFMLALLGTAVALASQQTAPCGPTSCPPRRPSC